MKEERIVYVPTNKDDRDCVVVSVRVSVPATGKDYNYEHVFDHPGLHEEMRPLASPYEGDMTAFFRRRELLEKRSKNVDYVARVIARSVLDGIGRQDQGES